MNKFYVYGLIDASTGKCFYVGKGCGDRLYRHVQKVKRGNTTDNPHLDRKIAKLLREDKAIQHTKFYDALTEDEAFSKEDEKIRELGIETLCNVWYGGKGGRVPTDETRKKISQNRKGIPVSDDARKKMSQAKKGLKHTEEWKQQQSVMKKGKPQTRNQQLANKKRSKALRGRKMSDEHRQRLREAKLRNPVRYWLGRTLAPETKDKIRRSLKMTRKRMKDG